MEDLYNIPLITLPVAFEVFPFLFFLKKKEKVVEGRWGAKFFFFIRGWMQVVR